MIHNIYTIRYCYNHILNMDERDLKYLIDMYNSGYIPPNWKTALEIIEGLPDDDEEEAVINEWRVHERIFAWPNELDKYLGFLCKNGILEYSLYFRSGGWWIKKLY